MDGLGRAIADGIMALVLIALAVGAVFGGAALWLWTHVGIVWPFYWK